MAAGVYFMPSRRRAVSAFPVDMLDREEPASPIGSLGVWLWSEEEHANLDAGENGVVYRVRLKGDAIARVPAETVLKFRESAAAIRRGELPADHLSSLREGLRLRGAQMLHFVKDGETRPFAIALNPADLEIVARRHMLLELRGLVDRAQQMTEMEFRGLHRLNQKRIVNLLRGELEKPDRGPAIGHVHRPGVEARIARFERIIEGGWNAQVEQLRAIADAPAPLPETDETPGF